MEKIEKAIVPKTKDVPLFGAEEMHAETCTGLFLMVCNM